MTRHLDISTILKLVCNKHLLITIQKLIPCPVSLLNTAILIVLSLETRCGIQSSEKTCF